MRNPNFRELRRRLLRGGVAPKHANRTVKELQHHLVDLEQKALSEGLSPRDAEARATEYLGDHKLIVEEALARPELKSWAYRWPWGIYGIVPVAVLVLAVLGSIIGVSGVLQLAENGSGLSPAAFANALFDKWWARSLLEAWRVSMVYAMPILLAGGLCIFAATRDAPALWPTIGVFVVLFLGFSYDLAVIPPAGPDELGQISAGLGWGTEFLLSVRVLRLLIPLVLILGSYYWWRHRQQESLAT